MHNIPEMLERWLKRFSKAVRERDFTAGKKLFHKNVFSFGTACRCVEDLEKLSSRQWRIIWPKTKNFDFDYDSLREVTDKNHAVIMTCWSSTGFRGKIPFVRRGRATIVLAKSGKSWKAVHTHFSLEPSQK